MAKRHPDNTVDGPESCRLLLVTFSGGWAGWPLEPAQALEGDVSSFQDTFINLPLILQAGEIPRSPIGFPLHRMEVGRIYTENNEILKREGKKKTTAVNIFNSFLKTTLPAEDKETYLLESSPSTVLPKGHSYLVTELDRQSRTSGAPKYSGIVSQQQGALRWLHLCFKSTK